MNINWTVRLQECYISLSSLLQTVETSRPDPNSGHKRLESDLTTKRLVIAGGGVRLLEWIDDGKHS